LQNNIKFSSRTPKYGLVWYPKENKLIVSTLKNQYTKKTWIEEFDDAYANLLCKTKEIESEAGSLFTCWILESQVGVNVNDSGYARINFDGGMLCAHN